MYVHGVTKSRAFMPKKDEMERVYLRAPSSWLARIEAWRSKQRPIPSLSEAIRQLTDIGIEAGKGKRRGG